MAKVQLAEDKRNVGEVAQRVEFDSKMTFAIKFRGRFGIFPKQFQQNLLKGER
jgi:AraC-like DNA-binding protein